MAKNIVAWDSSKESKHTWAGYKHSLHKITEQLARNASFSEMVNIFYSRFRTELWSGF